MEVICRTLRGDRFMEVQKKPFLSPANLDDAGVPVGSAEAGPPGTFVYTVYFLLQTAQYLRKN
jgi:hypothetical protein